MPAKLSDIALFWQYFAQNVYFSHAFLLIIHPCLEVSLNKCDKCNEVITGAGYTFRDRFWHDTCFGCDRCEEIFRCEMRILIILLILSSSAMASSESSGGRNSVINVSKQRQHRDPSRGFSPSTLF